MLSLNLLGWWAAPVPGIVCGWENGRGAGAVMQELLHCLQYPRATSQQPPVLPVRERKESGVGFILTTVPCPPRKRREVLLNPHDR